MGPGQLIPVREVARRIGLSERSARRLAAAGRFGPATVQGGLLHWRELDVAVYRYRLRRGDFADDPLPEEQNQGGDLGD